ncbi:MAG: hypothetical protein SCK70_10500 [bacterium]|nr:hypothetical protein [bacterium]
MKKLLFIWEQLISSFWFIPILMLSLVIGSAFGFIYLDNHIEHAPGELLKYLLPASVESARSLLTIIAGAGMLNAAFNQIRQYAEANPSVLIRLLEAMITINGYAKNKAQKKEIAQHAKMIMDAAERTFQEARDLNDMKKRFNILKSN